MPKRSLTPDFIARTALELGDREGEKAMSMRRIAAEIGCDPMAIYRHFPHREALLDAVADLAIAEVVPARSTLLPGEGDAGAEVISAGSAVGVEGGSGAEVISASSAVVGAEGGRAAGDWDARVRDLLTRIRDVALRHPGIAPHIASRPPLGRNGRALAVILHQSLADAGLRPEDVARAGQALIAYTAAALRMAVLAGERDERWYQVTRAIGHELPIVGSDEQFQYGLRLLLNGIKAEI